MADPSVTHGPKVPARAQRGSGVRQRSRGKDAATSHAVVPLSLTVPNGIWTSAILDVGGVSIWPPKAPDRTPPLVDPTYPGPFSSGHPAQHQIRSVN